MGGLASRKLAARCLLRVGSGGYSNLVFKQLAEDGGLERNELAFSAAVFYGTLERRITLDHILSAFLSKPLNGLDAEVCAVLESGLYQALYMDSVPTFAAINESVSLARALKKSSAAGLVNAVLRKASAFELSSLDDAKTATELSYKYSLNEELIKLLQNQYGGEAERIFKGFFGKKRVYARVNTLKSTADALVGELQKNDVIASKTKLDGAVEIEEGNLINTLQFKAGLARPQSLAAQLAAARLDPKPGQLIADFCAAPGGKALTAAQLMDNEGTLLCFDRSASRLKLLNERATLEGVSIIKACEADSSTPMPELKDRLDAALCDVPCSGYGETASKPELRQKPPCADGAELFEVQKRILDNAADCVRPGGRLVYSTCTVDKRENEQRTKDFLKRHDNYMFAPAHGAFADDGEFVFLPSEDNAEGFYIATFIRMC